MAIKVVCDKCGESLDGNKYQRIIVSDERVGTYGGAAYSHELCEGCLDSFHQVVAEWINK